jgi:putative hemolysin
LNIPPAAILSSSLVPPPSLPLGDLEVLLLAALALILTGLFAILRSALLHSVTARILERARSEKERRRLAPLLPRAENLAISASILEISCQFLFIVLVLSFRSETSPPMTSLAIVMAISIPLLVFASEVLPAALRGDRADALLRRVLPAFSRIQVPLAALIFVLEETRRATMRLFRIPEPPASARQIVEEIRTVVEDSDRAEGLDESEREIIENVVEFYDVDVAEVMTPRTDLRAMEVDAGIEECIELIAKYGHTRIPIFEDNLDAIIGIAFAREILQLVAQDQLGSATLRDLLRPVTFVPETKLVSALLSDFRRHRQKMAVVLDEYGGTAGIVTMGDILVELVGEIPEDLEEAVPDAIRRLADGTWEIEGNTHVSDVNEELEIELPEDEDFETIAGFVLARLGHLPKPGESFRKEHVEFVVADASDRRVLLVHIRLPESRGEGE